jgi:hypothetical protein
MSLTTIFQLYYGGQFYWLGNSEYSEKAIDLPQNSLQALSHNVVSSTPRIKSILDIAYFINLPIFI